MTSVSNLTRIFMKTLIPAFLLLFTTSAFAENCDIRFEGLGRGRDIDEVSAKVLKKIEKGLKKKGYFLTTSEDAEYTLAINLGSACGTRSSFYYASWMTLSNSGKQEVARGEHEASFTRQIFSPASIPDSATKVAFRRLLKELPTCETRK